MISNDCNGDINEDHGSVRKIRIKTVMFADNDDNHDKSSKGNGERWWQMKTLVTAIMKLMIIDYDTDDHETDDY